MNLEPIKAVFPPEVTWNDNIGNGMAIGKSDRFHITVAPDNTVRVLFGDVDDSIVNLVAHFIGDNAAARACLEKAAPFADANPTLPYFERLGEIGLRMVRRVAVETQFHELYLVLPKTPAKAETASA